MELHEYGVAVVLMAFFSGVAKVCYGIADIIRATHGESPSTTKHKGDSRQFHRRG